MVPDLFLGFDPGGERGFGVAMLDGDKVSVATVCCVSEAMDWAAKRCGARRPAAAGIDTLLHWCDGPGGWRPADKALRSAYPEARSSILSPNGLFGSMSIGGMVVALRLRERWPDLILNETHPKVLAFAIRGERHRDDAPLAAIQWFGEHAAIDISGVETGHELDAALSAWVTREGLREGWADLTTVSGSLLFPAGKVSYLWPTLPTAKAAFTAPAAIKDPIATEAKVSLDDTERLSQERNAFVRPFYLALLNGNFLSGDPSTGQDLSTKIFEAANSISDGQLERLLRVEGICSSPPLDGV